MDTSRRGRALPLTVEEKRARQNRLNRVARYKAKEEAVEYMGGKCNRCGGVFHSAAFDFHHTNPEEKDVDPGTLVRRSKKVLYAELAKCILLCSNCHRILHWELANQDTDWEEEVIPVLTLTVDGRTQSITDWANEVGISYETLRARVHVQGWTHERAVKTPVKGTATNKPTNLVIDGIERTLAEWSSMTGIPPATLRSRMRLGWDGNRIISTPTKGRRKKGVPEGFAYD